jgi:uncharacterized membrane protein YagU involved in acid resistance
MMSSLIYGVAVGTVAVALLDATDGVIYFWLTARLNPIQVLQYIASGAFGEAAYSGGLATAFAGLVFHFIISFLAVSVFAVIYTRSRTVRKNAPAVGLVYGAVVWCFMNLLVLPISAVTPTALSPLAVIHGVIGHALFVGLAAALSLRRYVRDEPATGGAPTRNRSEKFDESAA